MTRRRVSAWLIGLAIAGLAPAVRSQPAAVIRDLPYRREVLVPPAAPDAWIVVTADTLLMARCADDFSDVRFVDDSGHVRSLLSLPPRRFDETPILLAERVLQWEERADRSLGCELDLGDLGEGDVALLPPRREPELLRSWQCSSDRVHWQDGDGYRQVPVPGQGSNEPRLLSVDPMPGCRYLRLVRQRTPAYSEPETLRVYRREQREAPLLPVAFRETGATIADGRLVQTLTLPGPASAVAGLRIDRPLHDIPLSIELEARLPRFGWRQIPLTAGSDSGLWRCDPIEASALRLRVVGVDPGEPPFVVREVLAVRQRWAFPNPGPGRWWLLYGDRRQAPRAGYAELGFALAPAHTAAQLGPESRNPRFTPTGFGLAWLQRRPGVLTIVMLGILGLVAVLAFGGRRTKV